MTGNDLILAGFFIFCTGFALGLMIAPRIYRL